MKYALKNSLLNYNSFKNETIDNFKVDWAEYFENISKRNTDSKSDFGLFLDKYNWKNLDIKKQYKWKNFILERIKKY